MKFSRIQIARSLFLELAVFTLVVIVVGGDIDKFIRNIIGNDFDIIEKLTTIGMILFFLWMGVPGVMDVCFPKILCVEGRFQKSAEYAVRIVDIKGKKIWLTTNLINQNNYKVFDEITKTGWARIYYTKWAKKIIKCESIERQ